MVLAIRGGGARLLRRRLRHPALLGGAGGEPAGISESPLRSSCRRGCRCSTGRTRGWCWEACSSASMETAPAGGRCSSGSILLYSLANLANAFVGSVDAYRACRFIAGLGLAGELGAGVTLVAELMPARIRGYGTAIIASMGLCGGLVAPLVAGLPWRTAYVVGAVAGLSLLVLRLAVQESGIFKALARTEVPRGTGLFAPPLRLARPRLALLPSVPDRAANLVRGGDPDQLFSPRSGRDWACRDRSRCRRRCS